MTSKLKRAFFAALILILLALAFSYYKGWLGNKRIDATLNKSLASNTIELSATDVVTVQKISMTQGLPVSGTLKATRSAMVKARVAGELQALEVREGDAVVAGQILARVDATEYLAKQRQAQQQAEAARAQVEVAQRQFDNNKALMDQGFISKTALDISESTLRGAKAC